MKHRIGTALAAVFLLLCSLTPLAAASEKAASLELQACQLVNQQRLGFGLQPLQIDPALGAKARIKSRDMLEQGYFAHTSPTYGSPFAMMRRLGISYRSAGENIAMGYDTPSQVVGAWMASEGHRANLLSKTYDTMGIGHVSGYWTQWLLKK